MNNFMYVDTCIECTYICTECCTSRDRSVYTYLYTYTLCTRMCTESCMGRSQSSWPVHSVAIKPNELRHVKVETLVSARLALLPQRVYILYTEPNELRHLKSGETLIERTPPSRGGILFTMFHHQEPCVRGPPSKNLVQILRGGSSYTWFLMREHSK